MTPKDLYKKAVDGVAKVANEVVDLAYGPTMQRFVGHGASEIANALYGSGQGFVLYGHGGKEQANEMAKEGPQLKLYEPDRPGPEVHNPEITQSREQGREM